MDIKNQLTAAAQKVLPGVVDVPKPCIDKALGIIQKFDISECRVPFITDDENVKQAISEFGLENPEKCMRFIVEAFFAQAECIIETNNTSQQLDLYNSISYILTGKDSIYYGMDNPNYFEEKFSKAYDNIALGTNQLMEKVKNVYIKRIDEIDNRSKLSFFLKSKVSLKDIDNANHMAKDAVIALIDAYNLQVFMASKLHTNINSIHRKFDDFARWFDGNSVCRLMHAYDDEKQDEFWLKVPQTINCIEGKEKLMLDYIEEVEELSEDNIDFGG